MQSQKFATIQCIFFDSFENVEVYNYMFWLIVMFNAPLKQIS